MAQIRVARSDDVIVLLVAGRLAGEGCREVYKKVEECLNQDLNKIALDLSKLQHVDSEGIGMLVGATVLCRERGNRLKIYGVPSQVMQVLKTTNLNRALNLYDALEAAKADDWEYTGYRGFR